MNEIPHDLENYLASEKMDGVRARWDGENFITRHGNLVNCPDWFKEGMPDANFSDWVKPEEIAKTINFYLDNPYLKQSIIKAYSNS
jgi:DNA ligase-1